ncbi:MAG TPA: MFS transporter [Candidatus Sulfotelmatobacter sp.]|nr:MFS transporter [Candidatus Sulfotelmatobacter sp.]
MELQPEHEIASISLASYVRLVRHNRNFRRLWLAQIVSEIGDWFYTLSIYTLLLQLTGRASAVALALVLQVLPQTLAGPTAGVVNDRLRRKHVMIAADLVRVVIVLAMLFVRSSSTVWLVYPLLLAETVMVSFFEPARNAVIPNISAPGEVLVANTLSSATWSVNLMIGAGVGGLVAAFLGRNTAFVLNALSFLVSAILISGMKFSEPHTEAAPPLRPRDLMEFSPVLEGIRYIRSHPVLIPAVFAKAGELMVGPSWVIFTVMGAKEFAIHGRNIDAAGAAMLGMSILLGGRGIGALFGPLVSARWAGQDDHRLRLGILFGYLAIAFGYAMLGLSKTVWLAAGCAMLAHAGGSTVWVFSTTLLQLRTEDRFRGRLFAADLGLGSFTFALTAYLCGRLLDMGISAHLVAAGTGLLMLVPATLFARSLRAHRSDAYAAP